MMIGKITPVSLPFDPTEDRLIRSRQNKLARDIDIIRQKIRNNILSASEGNMRIQFKKAEIDQLQRYRGSKRNPTGALSPSPKSAGLFATKKSRKPAKKYNATDSDRVGKGTEPTGMFRVDDLTYNRANPEVRSTTWAEDDRAGMTSKNNQRSSGSKPPTVNDKSSLNQRGYSPNNYYSRFVKNYVTQSGKSPSEKLRDAMKADAERLWRNNKALPKLVVKKKNVRDNPHSFDYGTKYSTGEKALSFNAAKQYKGRYYGPGYNKKKTKKLFGKTVTVAPATPSTSKKKKWDAWNKANNISGFAGMPDFLIQQQARARRDTALMRKRMGSRLKIDNPNMTTLHRSQDSPRQVMRPNEPVSNLAGGLTKTRNSMQRLLK